MNGYVLEKQIGIRFEVFKFRINSHFFLNTKLSKQVKIYGYKFSWRFRIQIQVLHKRYIRIKAVGIQKSNRSPNFGSVDDHGEIEEIEALVSCDWKILLWSDVKEVPYTHRRMSLLDSDGDRKLGEMLLKKKEELEFKGTILSSTHPLSVKVCFILKQLLDALHRDLGLHDAPTVTYRGSDEPNKKGMTAFSYEGIKREIGEWRRDKSGLRGMNWQVVVADKPEKEAYTLGGGIIVVSSGLLDSYSDVGIAAVLAHQVGHSVARHVANFLSFACYPPRFYPNESSVVSMPPLVDKYQRVEEEASNIGSQLMASAGYDPLEYENLEINYSKCEENGPISLEERCTSTTHVKEEALAVYRRINHTIY